MPISIVKGFGTPIYLWAPLIEVEIQALHQLKNVAALPWVFHHVAAMADCHFGKGATVGSVIAMENAVAPAAVGVDIGCGMGAVKTSLTASNLPDSLRNIRLAIEAQIPVGFNWHKDLPLLDTFAFDLTKKRQELFNRFKTLSPKVQDLANKAMLQCGTLGGGNHFIELCLDTAQNVWLMLHSGSRNIGKTLAEIHIATAKNLIYNKDLAGPDLAVLLANTDEFMAYRHDLYWAQEYAFLNREIMFELYKKVLGGFFPDVAYGAPILCHHNYVSEEVHYGEKVFVTRKGAIRAGNGELGIIPGSMGTKSYIVRGLGNPESFESASHGAGRQMSRNEAKRRFTVEDVEKQTTGVECRKDAGVIDELPASYKDIEQVMKNQQDLVTVVAELKQVLCVKG